MNGMVRELYLSNAVESKMKTFSGKKKKMNKWERGLFKKKKTVPKMGISSKIT